MVKTKYVFIRVKLLEDGGWGSLLKNQDLKNIKIIIYTIAAGILFGLYLSFSSPNVYRAQVLMVEAEQIGGSSGGGASGKNRYKQIRVLGPICVGISHRKFRLSDRNSSLSYRQTRLSNRHWRLCMRYSGVSDRHSRLTDHTKQYTL